MDESWVRTWYDRYVNTPKEKRKFYVYAWFESDGEKLLPFYVGMGSGNRVNHIESRSKTLQEYIRGREFKRVILARDMPCTMAMFVEQKVKAEFKARGFHIIDAEDDREERKRRQAEGIAAMPVDEEGYKISSKTGRRRGATKKDVELMLVDGESVSAACRRLGIGRSTYYRRLREMEASS